MREGMKTYFILDFDDYLGRNDNSAWVKIGRSKDLSSRLQHLRAGNKNDLLLTAYIEGDHEKELHKAFAEFCKERKREWFLVDHLDVMDELLIYRDENHVDVRVHECLADIWGIEAIEEGYIKMNG